MTWFELLGPPSKDISIRARQANAVIVGDLMYDPVDNEYKMLPDGEGFCPRCLLPLTQCNCKERKV